MSHNLYAYVYNEINESDLISELNKNVDQSLLGQYFLTKEATKQLIQFGHSSINKMVNLMNVQKAAMIDSNQLQTIVYQQAAKQNLCTCKKQSESQIIAAQASRNVNNVTCKSQNSAIQNSKVIDSLAGSSMQLLGAGLGNQRRSRVNSDQIQDDPSLKPLQQFPTITKENLISVRVRDLNQIKIPQKTIYDFLYNYDQGIVQKTHKNFITLTSVQQLFSSIKYIIQFIIYNLLLVKWFKVINDSKLFLEIKPPFFKNISLVRFSPSGRYLVLGNENCQYFYIYEILPQTNQRFKNCCANCHQDRVRLRYSLFRGYTAAQVTDIQFVSVSQNLSDQEQILIINSSNGTSHIYNLKIPKKLNETPIQKTNQKIEVVVVTTLQALGCMPIDLVDQDLLGMRLVLTHHLNMRMMQRTVATHYSLCCNLKTRAEQLILDPGQNESGSFQDDQFYEYMKLIKGFFNQLKANQSKTNQEDIYHQKVHVLTAKSRFKYKSIIQQGEIKIVS